jgi:hypothetical protein
MSSINQTWIYSIDKAVAKLAQYWRRDSGCAVDLQEIKAYLEAQLAAPVAPRLLSALESLLENGSEEWARDDARAAIAAAQLAAPVDQHEPWVPYLSDRADGCKGRYAIARRHPDGYSEFWNLRSHRWSSASEDVLTLDQAQELMRNLVIPTAPAFAPALMANDDHIYLGGRAIPHKSYEGTMTDRKAATRGEGA